MADSLHDEARREWVPLSELPPEVVDATDDELRALAVAAEPGPWGLTYRVTEHEIPPDDSECWQEWCLAGSDPLNEEFPWCEPFLEGALSRGWSHEPWLKELRFIAAANPERVLALLDERDALLREREELRAAAARLRSLMMRCPWCDPRRTLDGTPATHQDHCELAALLALVDPVEPPQQDGANDA